MEQAWCLPAVKLPEGLSVKVLDPRNPPDGNRRGHALRSFLLVLCSGVRPGGLVVWVLVASPRPLVQAAAGPARAVLT